MAAHSEVSYTTADGNDYPEHERTYEGFLQLVLIGVFLCLNIAVALAVGGYKGAWGIMTLILIVAHAVAAHGLFTGAKVPSYVMLVLSLLALALT